MRNRTHAFMLLLWSTVSWFMLDAAAQQQDYFCRSDSITRRDYQYCWFVDDEQPFRRSIPGVPQSSSMSEVSLRFVTNPDEVHILFAPGLGITRYEYQHHGSPSAVEAELIEYHKAAAPR